ncbi:hypothetical protein AA313_de0203330 [Arthrobotrys entomopaga]|nr:hypothetical protein AA313_de0203330 [Arthrobotrys entomopaga]
MRSLGYEAPTDSWDLNALDVDDRGRKLSEDTLLRTSNEYESSPGPGKKVNESSNFLEYITPSAIPRRFGTHLTRFLFFLIPSFLSSYFAGPSPPEKLSPTAWLDGLRGIACVVVVIYHYVYSYFSTIERPYDGHNNTSIMQLPIIKLVIHGAPMVKIFYIISGFVLTVKAVKLTTTSGSGPLDAQALISNLSSSIWKRWLRLYIPCAASFLLCAFMVSLGAFEVTEFETHPKWLVGIVERRPPMEANIFKQIVYAVGDFYRFGVGVTFFGLSDRKYLTDVHLWTIPVEFRNSISLFIIVAGACMLKRWLRVYFIPILSFTLLYHRNWGLALFVFGYFLAELHGSLITSPILPTNTGEKSSKRTSIKTILRGMIITVGLYLASYPRRMHESNDTTGFQFLIPLTPAKYPLGTSKIYDHTMDFWQSLGTMMIVWTLLYMPYAKAILCTKVLQYFGKISFALYIMHGHTHRSVGYWVVINGLKAIGVWHLDEGQKKWVMEEKRQGDWDYIFVTMAGFLFITFPMTVCWADVFWRAVDIQTVRFLRWLEPKIRR